MAALKEGSSKTSKWLIALAVLVVIILGLVLLIINSEDYKAMAEMKIPKYEVGEHRGAKFCAECHEGIYKEWLSHSRHAVATTNKNFLETRDDVEDNVALRLMMGEESCYACHGLKGSSEGINCEICHGVATADVPITEIHEKKFKPGLKIMRSPKFCAKCHELMPPLMSPYSDWLTTGSAKEGTTCQDCHMARIEDRAYHGFDSIVHKPDIYDGDLVVRDIKFTFPEISMVVENLIKGHGVPVGGPSRVLVLEALFVDAKGGQIYKIVDTFYKKFKLTPEFMGSMPSKELIEDTQLRSLEARKVSYSLPVSIDKDKLEKVRIMLKFYDVADKYQGDIEKSHWVSAPLFDTELKLR